MIHTFLNLLDLNSVLHNKLQATLEEIVSTIDNTIPAQCHCKIKDTVLPMDTVANPLKAVEKSESEIQTYALLEAQSLYVRNKNYLFRNITTLLLL